MVIVLTIKVLNVQAHAAIARKGLKELFEQFGVHIANFVAAKIDFPNEIRTLAKVVLIRTVAFSFRNGNITDRRQKGKSKQIQDQFNAIQDCPVSAQLKQRRAHEE